MKQITVHQLADILKEEHTLQDSIVIDVRTKGEFKAKRIQGVKNVPLQEIEKHIDDLKKYKKVYIHCEQGNWSKSACQKLEKFGLKNVINVIGGASAWEDEGFPVMFESGVISLQRQVQITAGTLILLGIALWYLVNPWFLILSGFVGAGFVYAGLSGTCGMAAVLAKMPWNT